MQLPIQPDRFELVRRQFKANQGAFGRYNAVFEDVSQRMLARMDLLAIEPKRILDLGCRDGYQIKALQERFQHADVIGADPANATPQSVSHWWRRKPQGAAGISADPHFLPFADASFDLVVSNLLLPWCHDPAAVFVEIGRVLAENGAFMFTSVGPDTLQEYSALWRGIDSAQHVFGLADMHQIGDELLAAGFAAPVLDREVITVDYPTVTALQEEMQQLGAANLACGRRAGLMSAEVRKKINEGASGGRFPVTLELVHGHGWKGALKPNRNNSAEEFSVSLDSLRQSLRGTGR